MAATTVVFKNWEIFITESASGRSRHASVANITPFSCQNNSFVPEPNDAAFARAVIRLLPTID
jgi:hypothetical protein